MRRLVLAHIVLLSFLLVGCGTFVPEIQEPGFSPLSGQQFVHSVIFNIRCEVQDAIIQLYKDYPEGTFLDLWGAQITLNLQVEEKSSANQLGIGSQSVCSRPSSTWDWARLGQQTLQELIRLTGSWRSLITDIGLGAVKHVQMVSFFSKAI